MLSAQNSPRKLPQQTRKVSESGGLVGGGVWASGDRPWGVAGGTTAMCHVVNTTRARSMQNDFLNTQKRRKRTFHAVVSLSRVPCVGM
jgi:hypothetical protein